MMQGRLIVLEGIDGSGKSTQYKKLCQRLEEEQRQFRRVVFPRYDQESSALIREYLGGKFGSKPTDVNAYAASTFYAVDRFASFKTDWQDYYNAGGLVLADRYTTSNACHQGSKLSPDERQKFFDWLYDFEFNLLGLPRPSMVVYLDIDLEVSRRQMQQRQQDTSTDADIHEKDFAYLAACLDAGRYAAQHYGWKRVECVRNGEMRTVEDIHQEIYTSISSLL
jgi:dTMP kinase